VTVTDQIPPDLDRVVAGFVHCLRRGGLPVPIGQSLRFRQALDVLGVGSGIDVYWAGRATLVSRPEEIAMFDAMFLTFFHHNTSGLTIRFDDIVETEALAADEDDGEDGGDGDNGEDEDQPVLRWSAADVLRDKDFADFTPSELDEAHQAMAKMRLQPAQQRSRRRTVSRTGDRLDLRRTVRAAMRSGGEPIDVARTRRGERTRRVVLLLDVSGSMEAYARVLIRFAHAAVVGRGRVEAFALGTRLTRMTRQLGSHDVDEAVAEAAEEVVDWSGGTRLGEAIGHFNDEWGVRGMSRGSIVVILSDGWDRGDPAEMAEQMARLKRTAHRVVWVNPLKAGPGYEPTARGMAAALPYIDEFLEGHSLRSLETLADVLA
jgi:uncharacterized protein with von Willebrand factor type A (vWA) domain